MSRRRNPRNPPGKPLACPRPHALVSTLVNAREKQFDGSDHETEAWLRRQAGLRHVWRTGPADKGSACLPGSPDFLLVPRRLRRILLV